jgi:putative sugar O-methyltransferase
MTWNVNNTDARQYLSCCKRAATDDNFFYIFKRDPWYRKILEHVSFEDGKKYLDSTNIDYIHKLEEIKQNDQIGSPFTFDYSKVGTISPTTLRYLKNTSDIINKFGTNLKSIVEIGGGYGGLCKVLSSFVEFENYLIVDLEEANLLSKKYLNHFDLPTQSYCSDEIVSIEENFDLLISNYAFSECEREVQFEYIEKFLKKSNRFYMLYNDLGPNNIHHEEFIGLLSDEYDIEFYFEHDDKTESKVIYGEKINGNI